MKRLLVLAFLASPLMAGTDDLTATGDLGLVIERATGSLVLDGLPGTAMPPWRPLLTEAEALWIADYLKGETP